MFRQAVSRVVFPNLDRDLSRTVSQQLSKVENMTDCMIAPTVHAYEPMASSSAAFAGATRQQLQRTTLRKVEYPAPGRGLFQD